MHAGTCQQKSARAKRLFRRGTFPVWQRSCPLAATVLLRACIKSLEEAPPPQFWGAIQGKASGSCLVLFYSGSPNLGRGGFLALSLYTLRQCGGATSHDQRRNGFFRRWHRLGTP